METAMERKGKWKRFSAVDGKKKEAAIPIYPA